MTGSARYKRPTIPPSYQSFNAGGMQSSLLCIFVLSLVPAFEGSATQVASPIAKVIELLSSLEAKIIKEGTASQKTYDEFAEWCEDRSRNLASRSRRILARRRGSRLR